MKKLNLFIFASLTFFAFGGSFSLPALAVVIGSNGFNVPSFSTATPAAVIVPVSVATASATTDLGSQYTPTSLAATAFTPTQINLSWGVVSGTDVTYQVWQSTVFNSGYAVKESDIDATATAITSLQPNTRYYFKVKACINGACSPVSELITAITLPVMPTNFRAVSVSSASQINLSWTPVNTLSYIASRATSLSGVFSDLPETTVGASTFTDTSLVANTRYYYRLKAKNVSGTSTLTDVITASTLLTAPSISGSATSSSEINLSWNAIAGNNVKYQVYKATTLNGSYALITTSDGISAATTSATGLNANTIYYFKVKSCKAKLCSGLSDSVAVLTKPATPTNFKVTNSNSASEISFSWTTDKTLSYLLSRATSLTGAYTDLAGTAVGASTFKDTGLVANTAYYYKLRAQNTAGLSAYTGVITTATLLSSSVLTANPASASQINLSWGSVTGAYYQIYQATTLNGAYAVVTTGTGIITNSLSVTTGLNANARYYFKVKSCITSTACSPLSDAVSALTLPSTPAGFKVVGSPTDTQIKFTWTADKSLSYVVSRAASTDGTYTDLAETVVGATVFTDTGLTANTTYYYKIKAKNASGLSVPSSAITVATSLIIPSLTATAINSSQINLSWNVVTNALYQVYQSGTASGTYAILPNANNVIATSAGVIGLQPGTKYYFKIKACIGNVCSLLSDPVMVLTYPTAPTTLTASKGTGAKVNLSWVANGTSTYVISRATSLAGTYTNIVETATGVTSYADTGVVLNTIYYYNIKAHNTSGYSANSSYASVSTY